MGNSGFSINLEEYQVDPQKYPLATKYLQNFEHLSLEISTLEDEYRLIAESARKEGAAGQTEGNHKDVLHFLVTYAPVVEKHPEDFTFPALPQTLRDFDSITQFSTAHEKNNSLYEEYGEAENLLQGNMQKGRFVSFWFGRHYTQYFMQIAQNPQIIIPLNAHPVALSTDSLKAKDSFLPAFWEMLRKIQQESMTSEKNAG